MERRKTPEKREAESQGAFVIRLIRWEALLAAADAAWSGPDNEPGSYAKGRMQARENILALIVEETPDA